MNSASSVVKIYPFPLPPMLPRGQKPGTVRSRDRRNKTGCIGISLVRTKLPSGRRCRFFAAHLGKTNRKFNIETLGRHEAWRRALKLRADFEKCATSILTMRPAESCKTSSRESCGSNPRVALQTGKIRIRKARHGKSVRRRTGKQEKENPVNPVQKFTEATA